MSYVFTRQEIFAVRQFWPLITGNAASAGVTPFVLVGLGSRESNWGLGLTPPGAAGTGDFKPRPPRPDLGRTGSRPPDGLGFGRGPLQLDWYAQPFARNNGWKNPVANIAEGSKVLAQCRAFFQTRMPSLGWLGLLRASLAAYNHGPGNVFRNIQLNGITGVDVGTTGNNYSMDVLDRASSFENLHAFAPDEVAEVDIGGDPQAAPSLFEDVLHQAGLGGTDWPAQPTLYSLSGSPYSKASA